MALRVSLPTINRADRSQSEDARRRRKMERELGAPRGTVEPNASLRRARPAQSKGAELTRYRGGENAVRVQTPRPQSPIPRQTGVASAPAPPAARAVGGVSVGPYQEPQPQQTVRAATPSSPVEAAQAEVDRIQARIDQLTAPGMINDPSYIESLQRDLREAQVRLRNEQVAFNSERLQGMNTERIRDIEERGLRNLNVGETSRLNQLNTGIGALGLGESLLGERIRRSERETSAVAREQFLAATSAEEINTAYQIERDAINRMWQSGENELAFARQVQLFNMQVAAQERLLAAQQRQGFFQSIASFGLDALLAVATGGASIPFSVATGIYKGVNQHAGTQQYAGYA